MQLAALLVFWDRWTWESIWFGNFHSPMFLTQNLQLHEADTRGVKVGRTKPQWPRVGCKDRSRKTEAPGSETMESWGGWAEKLRENSQLFLFPSFPRISARCYVVDLVLDLSAVSFCWVLVSDLFFLFLCFCWRIMDNLGSNVDALIVDVRLLTWNKTQRKVRFSRHWSVDRHLEALRGVPTGMAGTSQLFNSSACFLGFLLCIPLLLVQFGFSFPPFFFWLGCLLFGIFWKLSLEYLHFAQWQTAGNSSGTALGNVGFARGPCRFSDVVLPAPHLWVSGEPYPALWVEEQGGGNGG